MCIVAVFPKGVNKYDERVISAISSGLTSNNHSFGYAVRRKGEDNIYIKKGFIKGNVKDFIGELERLNLSEDDVLLVHGRIATHGSNSAELAHPFICSTDYKEVVQTSGFTKLPVLMHNGVFNKLGSKGFGDHSDTSDFAWKVASGKIFRELVKRDKENLIKTLDSTTIGIWGYSKVVYLLPEADTEPILLGEFIKEEYGYFSNSCYKNSSYRNVGGVQEKLPFPRGRGISLLPSGTQTTKTNSLESLDISKRYENADIFKGEFEGFTYYYSNTRLYVNKFNYLFLRVRLRMNLPKSIELKFGIRKDCYYRINSISNDGKVATLKLFPTDKATLIEQEMAFVVKTDDIFDYFDIYGRLDDTDFETTIINNMISVKAYFDYELLITSSNYLDGELSKSYTKGLVDRLDSVIDYTVTETSRTIRAQMSVIKNEKSDQNGCWQINKRTIKTLNTNKNSQFKEFSTLALIWFLLERCNKTDINSRLMVRQLSESLMAEAFKLGFTKSVNFLYKLNAEIQLVNKEDSILVN